jgi:signal peptidase I
VVIGAVIVASLLRGFVGQMFLIPSGRHGRTRLRVDDRAAVEKLSSLKSGARSWSFKDRPGGLSIDIFSSMPSSPSA